MSVKLFSILSLALVSVSATSYTIQDEFSGSSFWDNFDFYTESDPTDGWVDYVSYDTAVSDGLIPDPSVATWGVDNSTVLDASGSTLRSSIRMTSKDTWTHGLFIADIAHMPSSTCGVWPSWWTFGQSGSWPESGEIDIIEFVNNADSNLISAHTTDSCTISGTDQSGTLQTDDCALATGGTTGCSTSDSSNSSVGTGFNEIGGGVYAMEWTSDAIKVWFFPRTDIPDYVTATNPDTSNFGTPVADIAGSCDIDTHFWDHAMVFDTTFCGTWAGTVFGTDSCPTSSGSNSSENCIAYVAENPTAFTEAYWAVNSIKIYQAGSNSSSSSSAAAETSYASTTSNSYTSASMGQQGNTSTLAPVWTTSTRAASSASSSFAPGPNSMQQATTAASSSSSSFAPGPNSMQQATTAASSSSSSFAPGPDSMQQATTAAPQTTIQQMGGQQPTFAPRSWRA